MNESLPTPVTLHIFRKLMSWRGRFHICDSDGMMLYECVGKWGWFNPPWVLTRDGLEVAVFKRKLWTWLSTWNVSMGEDSFQLRRKSWTLRRHILIEGGSFDGAVMTGSLFDRQFEVTWRGRVLARAQGKFLTLRERHDIEVLDHSPQAVLFIAVLMANLLMEKQGEHDSHSSSAD